MESIAVSPKQALQLNWWLTIAIVFYLLDTFVGFRTTTPLSHSTGLDILLDLFGSTFFQQTFSLVYRLSYLWILVFIARNFNQMKGPSSSIIWIWFGLKATLTVSLYIPFIFANPLIAKVALVMNLFEVILIVWIGSLLILNHHKRLYQLGWALVITQIIMLLPQLISILLRSQSDASEVQTFLTNMMYGLLKNWRYLYALFTVWIFISMRRIFSVPELSDLKDT